MLLVKCYDIKIFKLTGGFFYRIPFMQLTNKKMVRITYRQISNTFQREWKKERKNLPKPCIVCWCQICWVLYNQSPFGQRQPKSRESSISVKIYNLVGIHESLQAPCSYKYFPQAWTVMLMELSIHSPGISLLG